MENLKNNCDETAGALTRIITAALPAVEQGKNLSVYVSITSEGVSINTTIGSSVPMDIPDFSDITNMMSEMKKDQEDFQENFKEMKEIIEAAKNAPETIKAIMDRSKANRT